MKIMTLWGEEEYTNTRTCYKCGEEKTLDNFMVRVETKNRKEYRNECKQCKNAETKRASQLKREYASCKPTIDDECIICQRTEREIKDSGRFSQTINPKTVWTLDHCHDTGQFRGWICNYCNMMLSRADDNPTVLERGAMYIRGELR
jgi:hypothetical protein